jgi:hypothetical protein
MRFGGLAILILVSFLTAPASAATYHIDALNGSDAAGDGSAARPWQTLAKVRPVLAGGDTVLLYDGNYGAIEEVRGGPANLYGSWVTYAVADGRSPTIDHVLLGADKKQYVGDDQTDAYDAYLRLQGLHIADGVAAYGARHLAVIDCLVERQGPTSGSAAATEKTAVLVRGGDEVTVQGCEITNTGVGISAAGHHVRLGGNHIHHGTNDAIRAAGLWDSEVEGNLIHDFDDTSLPAKTPPSRARGTGLAIVIPAPGGDGAQNHDVVFRSNVIHDVAAHAVRMANCPGRPQPNNELIAFENNILGPTGGTMFDDADAVAGLLLRHNTVVTFPGGRTLNGRPANNTALRVSRDSTDVEIYNNILGATAIETGAEVRVFDWNFVQTPGGAFGVDRSRAYGRFTIIGGDPLPVDREAWDGRLQAESAAINAGTRLFAPDPLYPYGFEGTRRDARPDMGAWEAPGQSPAAETPPPHDPAPKTMFVDDFERGHYAEVDPWLDGPGRTGLSWSQPDGPFKYYVTNGEILSRNALYEPTGAAGEERDAWIFSDQGYNWIDYDFDFDAFNNHLALGGGPMVLVLDQENYYWLDIAGGQLLRRMVDGTGRPTSKILAASAAVRMPDSGVRHYHLTVRHGAAGITIAVTVGTGDRAVLTCTDNDAAAVRTFAGGGVGFHGETNEQYAKLAYDNVAVNLRRVLDEQPPQIVRWEVLENHGTAGRIAVGVADGDTVANLEGICAVRVVFSKPVTAATATAKAVRVRGQLSGVVSRRVAGVTLDGSGREMTISFNGPLPDQDRYVMTIADSVRDVSGNALAGNRDRVVTALAGDVNGYGTVTSSDLMAVQSRIGAAVTAATARYDVNGSGMITAADLVAVRAMFGHAAP